MASLLLTIIIPVHNEAGNIGPLLDEIDSIFSQRVDLHNKYEIIVVNDGSTDGCTTEVAERSAKRPHIRLIHHPHKMGMSVAIRTAALHSAAPWIMTIDGDGQNDPADMPRLLDIAWSEGLNHSFLVAGLRVNRQDTTGKRWASKIANFIRNSLLHDGCPDTGCALKLLPREKFLAMPFFNGIHRFLPALAPPLGLTVLFTPVNDRPRLHGVSKSDYLGRALRGTIDLMGVYWLLQRLPKN